MIRTFITPQTDTINLSLHVPQNYIGKPMEVLLYTVDEVKEEKITTKNPASLRGKLNLSDEQYTDFQQHIKDARNEWNRDI
jgi:hypothetical protein